MNVKYRNGSDENKSESENENSLKMSLLNDFGREILWESWDATAAQVYPPTPLKSKEIDEILKSNKVLLISGGDTWKEDWVINDSNRWLFNNPWGIF